MFTTDSPAKKASFPIYSQPSMPHSALFTTFSSVNHEKENFPEEPSNDSFADFPEPSYESKLPMKRTLMEAAPLKERSTKKQKRDDATVAYLPEPHDMPPVEDDGSKPPYSYATLIGMSILRANNRRLTLAQIYKWISDTFSYYKNSDPGWQNSIRHNLSLNKAFIKQERPKDDPGKGNYWAIEPGMEAQFLKDKQVRRATMSSLPLPAAPQRDLVPSQSASTTTWMVPPPPASHAPSHHVPAPRPAQNDLSSDATLPASDPALQDDSDEVIPVPAPRAVPRSSPPQTIRSSPPIAPPRFARQGTPPTPTQSGPTPAPRPRKRKSITLNDSGYFSSLESSALRPNKAGHILTSDLDIEPPRIKRGRAEEEIARMRSSSHDISPGQPAARKNPNPIGSSPLRSQYISMQPPPLTPIIKFKKPAKPPPSVSPNTNLRNHRRKIQQMVNSPIKHLGLSEDVLPWSPAFNLQDESYTPHDHFHTTFDVFADPGSGHVSYGSPEKRSVKRPRNDSGNTALSDITSVNINSRLGLPSLPRSKSAMFPESPSKLPDTNRFGDAGQEDFFSFHLFDESTDGPSDVDGIDLLQGFQKIGGASKDETLKPKAHHARPQMGHRSNTTLF